MISDCRKTRISRDVLILERFIKRAYAYVMSPFSPVRTGTTQAQAQDSQPFRPPSCLTLRGAGIENSVKKWFSAHASVLVLM